MNSQDYKCTLFQLIRNLNLTLMFNRPAGHQQIKPKREIMHNQHYRIMKAQTKVKISSAI